MSWPLVKLKDVCTIVGGATPKRNVPEYWAKDVPWVTPKDISKIEMPTLADAPEYISDEGFKSCSAQMLPENSILVTSRAPIGNIAITGREMCTNQGFKSLVPGPEVDTNYLYHCMMFYSPRLQALGNGATFKEVSKKIVENFEIPLPPLDEQKRIAAILDKADGLRRKRASAIQRTDTLLRSVFLDMFGDPVTNPKGWKIGTIRELLREAKYGTSQKANEDGLGIPVLRMGNITYGGEIDLSALKHVEMPKAEYSKYTTKKDDILFNRTNSKELVGKTAVVTFDEPMAIAGYLVRARINHRADPYYIGAYLNSAHGKTTLQSMCKSIVGMANINAQELQNIKVHIPPIDIQKAFRAKVEIIMRNQNFQKELLRKQTSLMSALVQQSFKEKPAKELEG